MTYNYLTRDEGLLGRETDSDHPTHGEVWSDLLHPRCIVVGRTKHPVQFRRFTMLGPPKLTDRFFQVGFERVFENPPQHVFPVLILHPNHLPHHSALRMSHWSPFLISYLELWLANFSSEKKNDAGQPCVSKMVGIWFKLKRLPTNGSMVGISSKISQPTLVFFVFIRSTYCRWVSECLGMNFL